jgi:hypothetical protein
MGINESREMVGVIGTFGVAHRSRPTLFETNGKPFYWKPGMVDPFMLEFNTENETDVQARAINNAGVAVGSGDFLGDGNGAVIWKDGMAYNLLDLIEHPPGLQIARLEGAADINNNGQILAFGDIVPDPISTVTRYALLLTPIPSSEPSAATSTTPVEHTRDVSGIPSSIITPSRTVSRSAFAEVRIDVLDLAERRM